MARRKPSGTVADAMQPDLNTEVSTDAADVETVTQLTDPPKVVANSEQAPPVAAPETEQAPPEAAPLEDTDPATVEADAGVEASVEQVQIQKTEAPKAEIEKRVEQIEKRVFPKAEPKRSNRIPLHELNKASQANAATRQSEAQDAAAIATAAVQKAFADKRTPERIANRTQKHLSPVHAQAAAEAKKQTA